MTLPTSCPCGSSLNYSDCCQLIHQNPQATPSPEKLMRSRYSAFVVNNHQFIYDTYHSSCQQHLSIAELQASESIDWIKLEIVSTSPFNNASQSLSTSEQPAFVEFKAWFNQNGQLQLHHEKSRFLQENIQDQWCWRYIDGEFLNDLESSQAAQKPPKKINRNDPCPCNSGKKYKKCCL